MRRVDRIGLEVLGAALLALVMVQVVREGKVWDVSETGKAHTIPERSSKRAEALDTQRTPC